MNLSLRFDHALQYATHIHAGQLRKGTGIPYLAHLLAVTSIALEHGANEDEAIGALLHDAGEDAGGAGRIADIRLRFGDAVADIVEGCTDTVEVPKPPWRARKEAYIAHIAQASPSVRLVSGSDKLHNARSILSDFRIHGDTVWSRFRGDKAGTLWYYRALVTAFRQAGSSALLEEFDRVDTEIETVASIPTERPFALGSLYSRHQIRAVLGGSAVDYLPTKDGRVVCGCFTLDHNPEAPNVVIPGTGPVIEQTADIFCRQSDFVPIFLKRQPNEWEYMGDYRAARYSTDPAEIAAHHLGSVTPVGEITRVIFLEPAP
jgi:GTP pyrophosphokinase